MVGFQVKVENVVSFVPLGKKIPLNKLVSSIENAEYEPEQFPGLVYRIQDPRAAALIFSSGKMMARSPPFFSIREKTLNDSE